MFKSSFYSVLLRGITLVSRFLLVVVMARYLSPEDMGRYGIMAVSILLTMSVVGLEFHNFAARELLGPGKDQQARLVRDQLAFHLVVYVIVLPLNLGLFAVDVLPWRYIGWFYVLAVLEHLSQEVSRLFIYFSRPVMSNVVLFFRSGAWVYAVIAAFLLDPEARALSVVWAGWVTGVGISIAVGAYGLRRLDWRGALKHPVDWTWIVRGLRTAFLYFCSALAYRAMEYGDRYFIQYFRGDAMVGVYTFYAQIANVAQTFISAGVLSIMMPSLVSTYQAGNHAQYRALRRKLLFAVIGGVAAITGILAVGIYPLNLIVDRPIYLEHLAAYWILLGAVGVKIFGQIPHLDLYAKRRDGVIMSSSFVSLAITLAMHMVLVPIFGVTGAAISTTLGVGAMGLIKQTYSMQHRTGGFAPHLH